MLKSLSYSVIAAGALLASLPAQAATSIQIDTSTTAGWSLINPAGTDVDVVPLTSGLPGTWDQSAPWIGPVGGQGPVSNREWQYVFALPFATKISDIDLRYWADNTLIGVFFNGTDITNALTFSPAQGTEEFRSDPLRTISGSGLAQFGVVETITFKVDNITNGSSPSGFAARGSVTAVPEPGTWMLMIFGLGAVGFAMRRRQRTAVRFQFA